MRGFGFAILLVMFLYAFLPVYAQAGDWPTFRGPHGNGLSDESNPPISWSADTNIKWKAKLPAPGNSSPIVSAGKVFVTCAQDQGRRRSLYCFDRNTGKQLWVRTVEYGEVAPTHNTNPYCGSTPVADGKRVVVWHGSAGLYCYDFQGKELWSKQLGKVDHIWGYGASPILYRDRVVLHHGPGKDHFLVALDVESGEELWRTEEPNGGAIGPRNDKRYTGSWSTPVVVKIDGKDQLVCSMPTRVSGYDPDSGKILWYCNGFRGERGDLAYSSPLISNSFCVAIGGFNGPGIGFKLGGMGEITKSNRVWRKNKNPQSIGSGVFLDGYIYRPNAGPGTIECLEAETGKIMWTSRAGGKEHWGSIVANKDLAFLTNQNGDTIVFRPQPEKFVQVTINRLGEPSNSTPAISNGEIFVRTFENIYCVSDRSDP